MASNIEKTWEIVKSDDAASKKKIASRIPQQLKWQRILFCYEKIARVEWVLGFHTIFRHCVPLNIQKKNIV